VRSGSESARGAIGPPVRDLTFVLALSEVVFEKRLKPTTEITKKSTISRDRQIVRIMFALPWFMRKVFQQYTKQICKKERGVVIDTKKARM
jgi:hypothetical protein